MKLLALLSLSGKNSDEKCVAASLQKYFERFSSVVIVILLSQLLGPLDIISKQLQSRSSDLSTTTVLLYSHFSGTSLHCEMTGKQHCLVPRCWPWVGASRATFLLSKGFPMSGSSLTNFQAIQGLSLVRNAFKLKCSTQLIDITTSQLKTRFHSLQKTDEHFFCINPSPRTPLRELERSSRGPSIKYVTLQGGRGLRKCDSLWQGVSGVARAPQAPRPRGGRGAEEARQGPPGRSSRRNPLARGPNKLLARGPENRRYATEGGG